MMTNKGDAEEKLQCPYDKSHQILKHRMQFHLVKCVRNHPNVRIATCTFNATHRVLEVELKHHLSICPDRILLDKFTFKEEHVEDAQVRYPIPKLNVEPTEYWDDLEPVPTYNPEEHCKNNPILRNAAQTQGSSKRRNFRHEERIRMQQFADDSCNAAKTRPAIIEATQKQRRPAGKSAAINNNQKDRLDICKVMEELTLNAGVLTTPKIPTVPPKVKETIKLPLSDDTDKKKFNKDFPPLAGDFNDAEPKTGPWSAATLAMHGIALTHSFTNRSRGRGSFLAKKK